MQSRVEIHLVALNKASSVPGRNASSSWPYLRPLLCMHSVEIKCYMCCKLRNKLTKQNTFFQFCSPAMSRTQKDPTLNTSLSRRWLLTLLVVLFAATTCETRPNGSLAPNGITVVCPNAKVGDTFTIGGVMYTKRARKDVGGVLGLESLRDTDPAQLTTSCTTGVDDLSALFKVRVLACSLLRRCLVAACLLDLVSTLTPRAHPSLSEL